MDLAGLAGRAAAAVTGAGAQMGSYFGMGPTANDSDARIAEKKPSLKPAQKTKESEIKESEAKEPEALPSLTLREINWGSPEEEIIKENLKNYKYEFLVLALVSVLNDDLSESLETRDQERIYKKLIEKLNEPNLRANISITNKIYQLVNDYLNEQ